MAEPKPSSMLGKFITSQVKNVLASEIVSKRTAPSPLMEQLRRLFVARNADEEAIALREIEIFRRQQILANAIKGATPPLPAAKAFLAQSGISEHLKATPHLGILQDQVEIEASRHDYVLLWSHILFLFKQSHPGLGLASKAHFGSNVGTIEHKGKPITKTEMLQVIAALVNYGHLFGTFSTERALLYHIYVEPKLKRDFLGTIDHRIKPLATNLIDQNDAWGFFYTLAAWRATRLADPELRDTAIKCLQVLLISRDENTEDPAFRSVFWVYRKSRQLVTYFLHAAMEIGPPVPQAGIDQFLPDTLHGEGIIGYCPGVPETRMSEFLKNLERLNTETHFLSPRSNEALLRHLVQFKVWRRIQRERGRSTEAIIQSLFSQPHDWPLQIPQYHHFARIEIPNENPRMAWLPEIEAWRSKNHRADHEWQDVNFVISPSPSGLMCDIFHTGSPNAREIFKVALNIARYFDASWQSTKKDSKKLWLSTAQLGLRLLQLCVSPTHRVFLKPIAANQDQVGLAILTQTLDVAQSRARQFAAMCKGPNSKSEELEWFAGHAHELQESQAPSPVLVFLGTVLVKLESHNDESHEIDCAWAEFRDDRLIWHFAEVKTLKQRGGGKQLNRLATAIPEMTASTEKRGQGCSVWYSQVVFQ